MTIDTIDAWTQAVLGLPFWACVVTAIVSAGFGLWIEYLKRAEK